MKNYSKEEESILKEHYHKYLIKIINTIYRDGIENINFDEFNKRNYNKLIRFKKINKIREKL